MRMALTSGRPMRSTEAAGFVAALVSVVGFGTTFPALAELSRYPLASGQAMRNGIAALLLLAIGRRRVGFRKDDLPRMIAMTITGPVGVSGLIIAAERSTDPGSVGIIVGCVPLVTALIAPLAAGRRVRPRLVVCATLAVCGAILVQSHGARITVAGLGFAIAALLSEVVFISLGSIMYRRYNPLVITPWLCIMAVAVFVVVGGIVDGPSLLLGPTSKETFAVAYLGVAAAVTMVCWGAGLARLEPERFGLCLAAIPLATLVTSTAIGLSRLTVLRIAGCLVVAAAIGAEMLAGPAESPLSVIGEDADETA